MEGKGRLWKRDEDSRGLAGEGRVVPWETNEGKGGQKDWSRRLEGDRLGSRSPKLCSV